ncbi:ABC transporter substrate-binding subunit SaoX [Tissierella creatinophila]|uniref:Putative aliphatic sulfonates-binding protein n=1 Tax=Tissierella creatinophila DSM 6911 TaxID=1123403 RepID=A0A1U7M416_TISCR|nr:ABC transporter substrate-binding subunit SaoX [Tissierella creatinophila]OLS02025.1 putative aliphatic sulfonates-binding protein precursor [Tissierella creatinophila DSM 6911]
MKKRKLLLIVLSMLIISTLVGCGKKDEGKKVGNVDDDYEINLGYYNCDHMVGAAIGEAAGIYKDLGLNVKLTGNGKVPEAMAAGQMDAGYIGNRGLIAANGQGSPILIGANNHIGGSMYLVVANDIEKPEDLYGQKVSIGSTKDEGWIAGYSKILNLSTDEKDYDIVNISSDADAYMALATGQIKAFTSCDPWGSMAVYEGKGKIMATYMEMDDKMGICCAFSLNKKFVEEHPELAEKLLTAHQRSIEYVYEHPHQAAKIFAKYYNVPEEVATMTIYKKCVEEGRTLTWEIEEESFQHAYDVYKRYDLIEKLPKFEDLIAYDIYNAAKLDDFDEFIKEKIDSVFPIGMSYEDFKKKAMEIDE